MSAQPELLAGPAQVPADLEALFNTNDYVDLSALDSTTASTPNMGNSTHLPSTGFTPRASTSSNGAFGQYDRDGSFGNGHGNGGNSQYDQQGGQATMMGDYMNDSMGGGSTNASGMTFDLGLGQNGLGYGGEMLAGEGMDTVSDGLRGGDQNQGL